jgi:UDP-glucose 4-epimerase
MKILLVGAHSYIAKRLFKYLKFNTNFTIEMTSLRYNFDEKKVNLNNFDVCILLGGLVHKNERITSYKEYFNANVLLPERLATICRDQGVKHFIFLSSMAVFGKVPMIDIHSIPKPSTKYGKSKLEAELRIKKILFQTKTKLTIVRPPVVFGKFAKGNPNLLEKISKHLSILPKNKNFKSVIFINILLLHIYEVILVLHSELTHPQMNHLFSFQELIILLRLRKHRSTYQTVLLNLIFKILSLIGIVKKATQSKYYDFSTYKPDEANQLYAYKFEEFQANYE